MEKKVIAEEISHLLEVINEQSTVIKSYPTYIPLIELDIVINNIRNLYERYYELQKLNSLDAPVSKYIDSLSDKSEIENSLQQEIKIAEPEIIKEPDFIVYEPEIPVQEAITQITEKTPEPPVIPHKNIESVHEKTVAQKAMTEEKINPVDIAEIIEIIAEQKESIFERVEHETIQKEPVLESISEPAEKKGKQKKSSPDLFSAPVTLADKYKGENKSLNERFSNGEKNGKTIADKLQEKPIKDLKTAIGINDKFKFINELFDGNLQAYNDNIGKLNSFNSFAEAGLYLDQLREEYGWTNENDSFVKLSDMVIRRYL